MNKSSIFKSISNKRLIKATVKSYSSKSPDDLIKCHFHLISYLPQYDHPYKTIKTLSSNIEIRKYEASIWRTEKKALNTVVNNHGIPFYICVIQEKSYESGMSLEETAKMLNENERNSVFKFKVIPSMYVASVKSNVIANIQCVLNDRKKIIQELKNKNVFRNYDLENLYTASYNYLIPFKSLHYPEVWVRRIESIN